MKRQPMLDWLVPLIVVLALVTAGIGLFWHDGGQPFNVTTLHRQVVQMYGQGVYRNDSYFRAPIFRGTDVVALFVCLPLLVFSFLRYRNGCMKGALLQTGMLSFFLYYSVSLAFSAAFNGLFLVYTALFSASFFAFVFALTTVSPQALFAQLSREAPRRGTAVFMFAAGIGVLFLWLSEIAGPIVKGQIPADQLGPYTTLVTHALDMAVIAPAAIFSGIYLLRRDPIGYFLAVPLLILCTLIGMVVVAQTIFQAMSGITFPAATYAGMIGSWVFLGAWAVWLTAAIFRNLPEQATAAAPVA